MIKFIMTRKINKYLEEHNMGDAVEKFGLKTLVKCKVLNEIPSSILYYKGDKLYTSYGEEFYAKYVTHFVNGNIIVSHSIMNIEKTAREKRYFVIDGVGNDLTEMYRNMMPCIEYIVLTDTEKYVDANKNAIVVNMIGGITDTKHNVLCSPRFHGESVGIFQTIDVNENGEIKKSFVIIDGYCNIKHDTSKVSTIEY